MIVVILDLPLVMIRFLPSKTSRHLNTLTWNLFIIGTAILAPTSATLGQGATDGGNATTISSKQNVTIILDHDRTPEKSELLVKILVPQNAKVDSFMLSDPPRLVVDFVGVKLKKSEEFKAPPNKVVKQIRLGAHADKLRIVMDLIPEKAPHYEWRGGPRQAVLRITEPSSTAPASPQPKPEGASQAPAAAPPEAVATPVSVALTAAATPTPSAPTPAPTIQPTASPTTPPTKAPTVAPTATYTAPPTSTPTKAATPTHTHTAVPTRPEPKAKLPELSDRELEAALDEEVAKASAALERGEQLKDTFAEGEDLVDVAPSDKGDGDELEVEEEPLPSPKAGAVPGSKEPAKLSDLTTKDLSTATMPSTPPQPQTAPLDSLRANVVPAQPATEFSVESASFATLEPDHQHSFKLTLTKAGAQAQMSKVDATTYKIIIPKCGLSNLGLALPQYPPADFTGLVLVTPRVEGDSVEITAQVEAGTTLTTLIRDREIWIKKG